MTAVRNENVRRLVDAPWVGVPLRIALHVWRGFSQHEIPTRAAALTYATIFSLVPTIAVAFAMFRAFGGLDQATEWLMPKLFGYLSVGSSQVVEVQINEFLQNINGGALGGFGTLIMLVGVVSLMSAMEHAFNRIWEVDVDRSVVQRVMMYWTTITITPTLVLGGASIPAAAEKIGPLAWLLESELGRMLASTALPLLFVYIGFTLLYVFVPHRRVPLRAALVGAIVGGSLWWAALYEYAIYASMSVSYSKIYGSLGALAVFLVWIYVTWVIVLLGAQVAAATYRVSTTVEPDTDEGLSPAARELVALRVLSGVAGRFVAGLSPLDAGDLARELQLGQGSVRLAATQLQAAGLLLVEGEESRLVPACDPHHTSPADAVEALRQRGERAAWGDGDEAARRLEALGHRADEACRGVWSETTFADLVVGRARDA